MSRKVFGVSAKPDFIKIMDDVVAERRRASLAGGENRSALIRTAFVEFLERHYPDRLRATGFTIGGEVSHAAR